MDEILKDERFSHILTDPSFRRIPKKVRKIKVDNRFKTLLKSKKFKEKCNVDEHGCALDLGPSENLKKLYNMGENSSDSEDSSDENKNSKTKMLSSVSEEDVKKENLKIKKPKKIDDSLKVISGRRQDNQIIALNKSNNKNKMKIKNKRIKQDLKLKEDQCSAELKEENKLNDSIEEIKNNMSLSKNVNINNDLKRGKQADFQKPDLRFKIESDSEKGSSSEVETDQDDVEENAYSSDSAIDSSEEDSDEDSESDDSESKTNDTFDHQWEEQHERAPDTEEVTRRLAVCHMDWDRIRAVDLFAVFNSFKPPDTSIVSVKIYPSEFGLRRMEEEKLNGPRELVEKTLAPDEEEVEDKKGSKYHREKLRQYQMNRLKYFFAIVECDSPDTANTLYEQLNGMEYESSSVRFDIRFVPDDMTFEQEPTSVAENPDLNEYKPKLFVTTALQQVKVGLTWDETDPQRREVLQKAFTQPDDIEKDLQEYLASSSEESEEENAESNEDNIKLSTKERIQKYKALLESINDQEKEKNGEKYEMEISWEPGVKEKTENLVKEKLEEKSYTPFEELQKKKKEKQKLKKKEKKIKNHQSEESDEEFSEASDSDASIEMKVSNTKKKISKTNDELYLIADAKKVEAENDVSAKKKKKKAKKGIVDDFQVDVNDPRFAAIYTSPLYNIDPSDPHFKSTPGNLAIIAEKQRRLKNKNASMEETRNHKKMKYS